MASGESGLSEEAWAQWLTPFVAIQRLMAAGLEDREHAVNWLTARLQSGELRGAGIWFDFDEDNKPVSECICVWEPHIWKNAGSVGWKHDFWISGDYPAREGVRYAPREVVGYADFNLPVGFELIAVRFQPDIIETFCNHAARAREAVVSAPAATTAAATQSARRGAKRKDWWDHLWIEMIRRIRAGTLKPKNQTALLALLEDYVRDELHSDAGDSTLKPMASNLFKYLEEISGEIGENSNP